MCAPLKLICYFTHCLPALAFLGKWSWEILLLNTANIYSWEIQLFAPLQLICYFPHWCLKLPFLRNTVEKYNLLRNTVQKYICVHAISPTACTCLFWEIKLRNTVEKYCREIQLCAPLQLICYSTHCLHLPFLRNNLEKYSWEIQLKNTVDNYSCVRPCN